MFALEIDFHDGVSAPETLYVRRPHAIIGTSDFAHVVIEGAASGLCELRVIRGVGHEFRCESVRRSGQERSAPPFLEGVYSGEAELHLGEVTTTITPLDMDLLVRDDETPDRAGVRILRDALSNRSPLYPAIAIAGSVPVIISFPADKPIVIGRSRKCGLRLDASEVSSEHARVGFENGNLWVEDLGSTNGTFIGSERVSGRRVLGQEESIRIASETILVGVLSAEDLTRVSRQSSESPQVQSTGHLFPCLVGSSEVVKPGRFLLSEGARVTIGRDPACGIWVGSNHISRRHAEVWYRPDGKIFVTDLSTNGINLNGERIPAGELVELKSGRAVLDFGRHIEVALCISEDQEHEFSSRHRKQEKEIPESAAIAAPELRKIAPEGNVIPSDESETTSTVTSAKAQGKPKGFGAFLKRKTNDEDVDDIRPEAEVDVELESGQQRQNDSQPSEGKLEQVKPGYEDEMYGDAGFDSSLDEYSTLGPIGRFVSLSAIVALCGLIAFLMYTFFIGG